jgi:hypothetical protein
MPEVKYINLSDPKLFVTKDGRQIPYLCYHEQPCNRPHPPYPGPVKRKVLTTWQRLRNWWIERARPTFHFGRCVCRYCD